VQRDAIVLDTGPLPGASIQESWHKQYGSVFARNVTVATRGKYIMGDLLTRQVTECFGFKPDGSYSMRHLPVGHDEPLRAELIAFLHAVRSGTAPAVTGDEGVASLEIATQCLETSSHRPAQAAALKRRVAG
jgi:predicted dehydrogenase